MRTKTIILAAFCLVIGSVVASTAADTYTIDKSHSSIQFSIKHLVISKVRGGFNEFSGTIQYDEADMTKSSVEVLIQSASIDTRDEKRDAHLKSPDFFDTEKYPEITFKSKAIKKADDGYILFGDLTMHGVTKEVSIPFTFSGMITDPWGKSRLGASGELEINRQDYGVSWSQKLDGGGLVVGDNVKIEIEIEAIKTE
jgi:polyisoprenoid-binding protein YceI